MVSKLQHSATEDLIKSFRITRKMRYFMCSCFIQPSNFSLMQFLLTSKQTLSQYVVLNSILPYLFSPDIIRQLFCIFTRWWWSSSFITSTKTSSGEVLALAYLRWKYSSCILRCYKFSCKFVCNKVARCTSKKLQKKFSFHFK